MYPTANYNTDCSDGGGQGDGYCQTDNELLRIFAENSLTADERRLIADTLSQDFEPTVLEVQWDPEPSYEGDAETDVIYQATPVDGPSGTLAFTYCDDAVDGQQCDQHYVVFDEADTIRPITACHETGHAVGLTHGDDANPFQPDDSDVLGCMVTPAPLDDPPLGVHNYDQIRETYIPEGEASATER